MDGITIRSDHFPELDAFLDDRIYAFNRDVTGIDHGQMLNAVLNDNDGKIEAAIRGFTWGGTCEIVNLWGAASAVPSSRPPSGRPRREDAARSCSRPIRARRHGFRRLAAIPDYLPGSEKIIYLKALADSG